MKLLQPNVKARPAGQQVLGAITWTIADGSSGLGVPSG